MEPGSIEHGISEWVGFIKGGKLLMVAMDGGSYALVDDAVVSTTDYKLL